MTNTFYKYGGIPDRKLLKSDDGYKKPIKKTVRYFGIIPKDKSIKFNPFIFAFVVSDGRVIKPTKPQPMSSYQETLYERMFAKWR